MRSFVPGMPAAAITAIIAFTSPSHASCGLHLCPRAEPQQAASWQLGWTLNRSGFDIGGSRGAYSEGVADLRYARGSAWIVELHAPFLALTVDSRTVYGFANPMVLMEYRLHPGMGNLLGFGLQTEFPLGDADAGLAQEHFMFMPYASFSSSLERVFLGVTSGISYALSGSHPHASDAVAPHHGSHGAGTPLFVHPHEDSECSYRVSAGVGFWKQRARPEAFLSGQRVLGAVENGTSRDYINAGFIAPVLAGRFIITPSLEVPVTDEHRFEWAVGMGIGIKM